MSLQGVSNEDLADLIATTTHNLPKLDIQYAFKYQNYEVMNKWFKTDKVEFDSGTSILRDVVLDESGNARFVRLYQESTVNVVDVVSQLTVPWRQFELQWSVEHREVLRNSAPARFVNLLQTRRNEAQIGGANLLEERGWQSPDSSSDDLNPYGIPYWVPKITSAGEGFYGGSDTNYATTTAGIDPATSGDNTPSITGGKAMWRSYCAGGTGYYEAVNATMVRTVNKAFIKTGFQSPYTLQDYKEEPFSNYSIYANADTVVALGELARGQNDNVGADLARYQGKTLFNGIPVVYIAFLDADTSNPVYLINHSVFKPFVLSGDFMRETGPVSSRNMHNVFTTFVDTSFNFICLNRRRNAVINKI
jgi:hypothetical protein